MGVLMYWLAVLAGAAVLAADQWTKAIVAAEFTLGETRDFLPGLLDLTYTTNDGGAWGMLSGNTWLLLSVTVVAMLVCFALLLKHGVKDKLLFWAILLILGGGIGNLIDRLFRGGSVVDFLHFSFWPSFPVFNVADVGIVVGAGLLMLYFVLDLLRDNRRKQKRAAQTVSEWTEDTHGE